MELVNGESNHTRYERVRSSLDDDFDTEDELLVKSSAPFSWLDYVAFFAVGLSMMWTWSMILQAVPYFQRRFRTSAFILRYFQASNLVVFAVGILASTAILNARCSKPAYYRRLRLSLVVYVMIGVLLTTSTAKSFYLTPVSYFLFLQLIVFVTAAANGLSQNSAFAFAAGFGRTEYAPAIMTGEALAALLPSVIEICTVLAFQSDIIERDVQLETNTSHSAMFYFAFSIVVGLVSLGALSFLRSRSIGQRLSERKATASWTQLWRRLKWPSLANFGCLCISAISPVFAARIVSTKDPKTSSILFHPDAFIPLAIVLWNIGDLAGSLFSVTSRYLLRRPGLLFILSLARLLFIPLYLMCNVDGHGSLFGDWFYLIVVQFLFGLSHGWISGVSMMGVAYWLDEEDREHGGAFMGMVLVAGLVAGSVLGVAAARI